MKVQGLVSDQQEYKECPFCAETIRAKAIKCKHCNEFLEPPTVKNVSSTVLEKTPVNQKGTARRFATAVYKTFIILSGFMLLNLLGVFAKELYWQPLIAAFYDTPKVGATIAAILGAIRVVLIFGGTYLIWRSLKKR